MGNKPENTNLQEEQKSCIVCDKPYMARHFNLKHQKYCSEICRYIDEARKIANKGEVIKLYDQGYGLFKLGRKFRRSQEAIKCLLLESGIKVKNAEEQRRFLRKIGVGKWRKKILKPCKICGKPFYPKLNKRYCSVKCEFNDQERINQMRSMALKQFTEGKTPKADTSIEKRLKGLLEELGVPFKHQYVFGYWSYDFFVKPNILIEVDGDYWHANPSTFKQLNNTQIKNLQNDKRKTDYASARGYKLVRFWESDIKGNIEGVKKKLLEVVDDGKGLL